MSTHGIGVFGINSKFASGSLVFYEKAVGRTATGDVLTIGTTAVTVGGTGQDVDLTVYLGSSSNYINFNAGDGLMSFFGTTKQQIGTSSAPLTLTAGSPIFTLYSTCGNTSTTNAEPFLVKTVLTGANGYGGRSKFWTYSNVASGTNIMALKALMEYGDTGTNKGLSAGLCSEIQLANADVTPAGGGYAAIEIEYTAGGSSTTTAGALSGNYATFMYIGNNGDANGDFDDNGYFMSVQGLTAGANHLLSLTSETLKVGIGTTTRYLVLSQAQDGLRLGASGTEQVQTAGTPILSVYSTCASTGTDGTPVKINHTLSAAGGVGVGLQTDVGVTLAGGNYVAALYGVLTFATAGRITGIASGVVGECVLSAGTTQGTYCGLNSELVANSAVSSGTATSFLYMNIGGSNSTGKTTLNTNGYLFELGAGVVDTSSGLFDVVTKTPTSVEFDANLKIRIGGVDYFIPLSADNAFE